MQLADVGIAVVTHSSTYMQAHSVKIAINICVKKVIWRKCIKYPSSFLSLQYLSDHSWGRYVVIAMPSL